RGFKIGAEAGAEGIVPEHADHAHRSAEPRGSKGLISAFAAGESGKTSGSESFAAEGNPGSGGNKIEVDASDDHKVLFHLSGCSSYWTFQNSSQLQERPLNFIW